MKTLLCIFAHPDDESTTAGGTIAKYARAGWQVDLVTVTRGDAGGWGDVPPTLGPIAEVRTKELEEAARCLGVRSVTFLDYKDGRLPGITPGEIEESLRRVMEETKPDVVITHEPEGTTNHPDHVKVSFAATFAYQTYARKRAEHMSDDPNPPKLYYSCIPETVMSYLVKSRQFPAAMHDKPLTGVEDKRVTTVIDIRRFAGAKLKALSAHATQLPQLGKYMSNPKGVLLRQEYFVQRYVGETEVFMGKNDRVSDRL